MATKLYVSALRSSGLDVVLFCPFVYSNERIKGELGIEVIALRKCMEEKFGAFKVFLKSVALLIRAIMYRLTKARAFLSKELKKFLESELVVDAGYQISVERSNLYVALTNLTQVYGLLLAWLMKKPFLVISKTIGPIKALLIKSLVKFLFNKAVAISVRDSTSYNYVVKELKLKVPVYVAPDLAFKALNSLPKDVAVHATHNKKNLKRVIGLNIGPLLCRAMSWKERDFAKAFQGVISRLLERGHHVVLVPTVLGPLKNPLNGRPEADLALVEAILGELPIILRERVQCTSSHSETLKAMAECDVLVASRLHAWLTAISYSVPAILVSFEHRFFAVAETLSLRDFVIDARKYDDPLKLAEEVFSRLEEVLANYESVRQRFSGVSKVARTEAELHVKLIQIYKILERLRSVRCVSCGTCVASCPEGALAMRVDWEGLYKPWLDPARCTGCGVCVKVCPMT
jgi:polysaccharide pyruvyl transferase WcaK-like protein